MKYKVLTIALSSAIALGNIFPAFAGTIQNNTNTNQETTYIETAIGFMYPEKTDVLSQKNLTASLTNNGNNVVDINLSDMLSSNQSYITDNDLEISLERTEEDGKITLLKFKIDGLEPSEDYKLNLSGENYVTTTVNLDTAKYSKRVNISTQNTMILGDVNNDGKVDEADLKLLEQNINKTNSPYDLNGDGTITIADIAIVNNNMVETKEAIIFDTEILPSQLMQSVDIQKLEDSVKITSGSIENIFTKGDTVTLSPKDGEQKISISFEFGDDLKEISGINIVIPETLPKSNIEIKAYDENDNLIIGKDSTQDNISRMTRSSETVVNVSLGNRVAVKKVVIEIVPSESGVVVLDQVTFLKDVVDETVVEQYKVTNIVATEGHEKVNLSWRAVPNVTGYKVYYGENPTNLTNVINTDVTNVTVENLKNLQEYYFQISATSGDWESEKSEIISATPQHAKAPLRPDSVKATAGNTTIDVNWKNAENAETYNVYVKKDGETSFTKALSGITSTSATLTGLENDIEYTIYVTSQNTVGESSPSEYVNATPKKEVIVPPNLPTRDRISNDDIISVEISHPHHYDTSLYPDGFDTNWLIDGDYETSWVARSWWEGNAFTFTFNEPKDMDYLIWVPRLDGKYRESMTAYNIEVWTDSDDLTQDGTLVASEKSITSNGDDLSYHVLDFPKQEGVVKIKIKMIQWNGSPTNTSASEVAFYNYNDIGDRISELFADGSRTELASGVTLNDIEELEKVVSSTDGFVVDQSVLLKELEIAKGLLNNDTSVLGIIKDNFFSIDPQNDKQKYDISINNYQPLGVVGRAKEKITIFANIPDGETVQLIPTQYYAEADNFSATPITLQNGRNVITLPKIGSSAYDRGGSLYVTYKGNNADQIKLQILGAYDIPYLELHDFYSLTPENIKEQIKLFIQELITHVPTLTGNLDHQNLNCAEISLPNVLLSLPASEILNGIKSDNTTDIDAQVEKVYNSLLAWEELIGVCYKTYGIDDHINNSLETRQNIRYMQMFGSAFMYASGNHIGVGYSSVSGLINGNPISTLDASATQNNLYGWGIAHEIGHVMDKLGKPEVTNNIFSLMAQTYDGNANTLLSRLEINNIYEQAFSKVAVGSEGLPNNVFVQLAMFWQLHLAYDNADSPFEFYNQIYKLYRSGSLNNYSDMDKFAVASSQIAQKDLTEFFTRWGVNLSDEAKAVMQSYAKEDRAIYYLSDESRRQRLAQNPGNQNIAVTVSATVNANNPKQVDIAITNTNGDDNIQGYEILRNGKSIGFTTTNTFTDVIGSANNMTFTYKVIPVDILGNLSPEATSNEIRISYDNTIDSSLYTISEKDANDTVTVTFKDPTIVTGIKLTPKLEDTSLPTGQYTISVKVDGTDNNEYIVAKNGDFSKNLSSDLKAYVSYFNKPGDTEDKMWSYDAVSIQMTGIDTSKYNVEFIEYPGDNIEFLDMGIGRLKDDYVYGYDPEEDVIKAGTLIVVGKYRGNTVTNKVLIKGRYDTSSSLDSSQSVEERAVAGYVLMFDEIPENGLITSETSEGIFIFVPSIQEEENENDSENHAEYISLLPTEIKAEMYKVDSNGGQFLTTDTIWITMPSDDSLPTIELTH